MPEDANKRETAGPLEKKPDEYINNYPVLCKQIIDHAQDGIIVYDTDLRYKIWNPYMEKMSGIPAGEIIGKRAFEVFPFLKGLGVVERHEQTLKGETPDPIDFPYDLRETGKQGWASDTSGALLNEEGEIIGVIVVVRDITERKRMEEELRENSLRLESIIEGTHVGTWEWNVRTGETVFNETWAQIIGYTLEELSPVNINTWDALAHPDDLKLSGELLERHFSGELPYYDCERRMKHKDGRWVWVHDRGRVFTREADGAPLMMFGTHSDITDRKRIEAYRDMSAEILQVFNGQGSVDNLIRRVLSVVKTKSGLDAAGIRLQDGDDFPYFAQEGFSKDFLRTENSLTECGPDGELCRDCDGNIALECACGLVISGEPGGLKPNFTRGGSYWTNDFSSVLALSPDRNPRHNPRNQCAHHGYCSIALVPIRTKDKIVGLLQLNDRKKDRFSDIAIVQLEGIAAHIGEALMRKKAEDELLKARNELAHESTHDPLTGVLNRRAMSEALSREIARVKRVNNGLAVAIFDIDHFKTINDTHGHLAGDEALCGLVDVLKGILRKYDFLGRWGGDEFLIISSGCGEFEGVGFYDRLRKAVAANPLPTKAGNIHITISVGVKTWNENDDEEKMIEAADSALYHAKNSSRNRCCRAEK